MSAEENKAAVRHFWQDHLNTGNATLCENDFAARAVNHDPNSPPVPPGPEGMGQLIALYRTAFPDLTATVEDMVAEGDKVAYRLTFRGTHQGELMGMPATGKHVTYSGIGIDTVVKGRLQRCGSTLMPLACFSSWVQSPRLERWQKRQSIIQVRK